MRGYFRFRLRGISSWVFVIGHWSLVICYWSLVIGNKLKGRAFCQLPYMAFGH
ncbi:MAG: hypothetical protein F6K31_08300 [Symploca sp. SIO2G7]|nr:hypothetical protein [Symploca sp. SIO2G7]